MISAKLLLIVAILSSGGQEAKPPTAAVSAGRIKQYMKCMKAELKAIGVRCEKVEAKGEVLYVEYENKGDQRDIFVMACVLKLVRPLAGGCKVIQVVGKRKGKKLFNLTVPPEMIESVYSADLTPEEKKKSDELVKRCLEKAGSERITKALEEQKAESGPAAVAEKVEGGARKSAAAIGRPEEKVVKAEEAARGKGPGVEGVGQGKVSRPQGAGAKAVEVAKEAKEGGRTKGEAQRAYMAKELSEGQRRELAEAILKALEETELENVRVGVDEAGQWFVSFENRTYRSDLDAVGAAFKAIGERLPIGPVVMQVTRDAVPVCTIQVDLRDYAKMEAGLVSVEEMRKRWDVEPGGRGVEGPVEILAKGNSSFGKVDVSFRPWVKYQIGQENDPWESDTYILTQADSTVGKGWHLSLGWDARVTSGRSIVLSKALVRHTRWLGKKLLASGSVGEFRHGWYGWYGEVQWDMGKDRVGLIGSAIGDDLGGKKVTHGFGYVEREFGKLGLTARVGYGKFIESQRRGGVVSFVRRFGESTVAMEAVRIRGGEEGINFRITVPFGPREASKPKRVRFRTSTYFAEDYHSKSFTQADYLRGDHELKDFRGELTAPYVRAHGERLVEGVRRAPMPEWPVAPSWEGTSGLMRIPTADVLPDGWVLTGVSFMDRGHAKVAARTSAMPAFGAIGFLPNLEIVGRFTFFHDVKAYNWPYNMDRSFHIHYRVLTSKKRHLALAIGAQDIRYATDTTYIGRAEYAVATLEQKRWRLHIGGGKHRLDGIFGGIDYDLLGHHKVHLMAEYDTDYVNVGARVFLGSWGNLDIGTLGASRLCGAVTFRTWLR